MATKKNHSHSWGIFSFHDHVGVFHSTFITTRRGTFPVCSLCCGSHGRARGRGDAPAHLPALHSWGLPAAAWALQHLPTHGMGFSGKILQLSLSKLQTAQHWQRPLTAHKMCSLKAKALCTCSGPRCKNTPDRDQTSAETPECRDQTSAATREWGMRWSCYGNNGNTALMLSAANCKIKDSKWS